MLHELLFALSGYPGNIFVDNGDKIQVQKGLPFLHSAEEKALNRLCQLATHFKMFKGFINKYSFCSFHPDSAGSTTGEMHGVYLMSLCSGLNTLLEDYQNDILELEKSALADPHLPVSEVLLKLQQYELLFPALSSFLTELKQHEAHGCYILDRIHKASISGVPVVKQTFERLLSNCHGPLFKHLCAWMLYGKLMDPYKEFFIQESHEANARSCEQEENNQDAKKQGVYVIRADLLPSYIGYQVAKKILFVGESIKMFDTQKLTPEIKKLENSLRKGQENFSKDLFKLSQEKNFNQINFRETVNAIRGFVAEQLWLLVVEDSDIFGQLKLLKDIFLFGRGDLYQSFIDTAHSLLISIPQYNTEHELNSVFRAGICNTLWENDSYLHNFQLTCKTGTGDRPSNVNVFSGTVLNALGLTYTVQWPLHIFFTPSVLEKYECVFKFLMKVHYVQMELQHCWLLQVKSKSLGLGRQNEAKWQLRTHLAFLIDNLQYYLQVDVIESLHKILVDKILSVRDFEAVKLTHEKFLTDLLDLSLFRKLTNHLLDDLLSACLSFCDLIKNSYPAELTDIQQQRLSAIRKDVRNYTGMLFSMLNKSQAYSSLQTIDQFMLRIDYNRFVSKHSKGYLGGTGDGFIH
ncbi:gamma-tubulin complex component 4-like [Octopus vulgaris]|uniref:Gamma-tubulin complex component n=1 Tax=Octopus vulgaris TaxID=6645 RepID=A0AA36ANP6_OCTVU|nr:gamma-tubulin complex component 4-like [Octopus vulgaris]